MPPLKRSKCN